MAEVVRSDEEVWHYTTTAGLESILNGRKFWATSAAMLNDTTELGLGRSVLRELLGAAEGISPAIKERALKLLDGNEEALVSFILSASRAGDSLTLWRNYGGHEVAYALKLDRARKLIPIEQIKGEKHPSPPPNYPKPEYEQVDEGEYALISDPDYKFVGGGTWRRVSYIRGATDPKVTAQVGKLVKDLTPTSNQLASVMTEYTWQSIYSPTVYWKHQGFMDEREVRAAWTAVPSWKFVKYRPGRFGLVPYIEVASWAEDLDYVPNSLDTTTERTLPITEIRIGPTRFPEDAERALRMLLDDTGFGHVAIHRSGTPFR